jgi:sporulation protein YlmC with PRC-barrel domain
MTAEKTMTHLDHVTSVPTLSSLRDTDRTISSSDQDIRGRMVKDKDGRDLGRIEDLLVDDIERKVRFMEVATGGFLGFGESKSFIPIDAITRMTPDEVYISHTREHVAGAPRYDPDLVPSDLHYFFNLYPYYGYPASFGLFPQPLASPEVTSDATAAMRTGA